MKILSPIAFTIFLTALGCATADELSFDDAHVGQTTADATSRGSFDLWIGADDQYYFHLEAGNHEILMWSEGYQTRTGALNGILSVLDNAGLEHRYQTQQGTDGQYYVSLKAANGEIIAQSEGYVSPQGAERAITASISAVAGYLEHWDSKTGARFHVFEATHGQFRFNLHAANGEIVLTSEAYTTEAGALNGAFAVAESGQNPARYEVLEANDGGFYFNLKAANGEIVGTSEVYVSKSNAERGVEDVIALLPEAELL